MTKEELQEIISRFNEEELKELGIFGIFQYGGGPDESYIRANKEGMELVALELLKSARDIETALSNANTYRNPIMDSGDWIDENSDTMIHYLEPVAGKQKSGPLKYEASFLERVSSFFGCMFFALLLIVSIVVGFFTILGWLF
jgi:hypothetical protein